MVFHRRISLASMAALLVSGALGTYYHPIQQQSQRQKKVRGCFNAPRTVVKYDAEAFVCKPERIPLYMHSARRRREAEKRR